VLPHRGGGAEAYVDQLELLPGYRHRRVALSGPRGRMRAIPSVASSLPNVARLARTADVIHVHGDTASFLCGPLLRRRPSVATTHGLHRLRRLGGRTARGFAAGVLGADRVVCTSEAERRELAALAGARGATRLVAIPNGAAVNPRSDRARAEARAALNLGERDVVALFVAELEPRKDPILAATAAEAVRRRGLPLVLLMAGTGSLARAVEGHAGPGVRPLGFRDDVERLYPAADIFVMPSWREGVSMALLEAMSNGVAVMASDIPGTDEAVGTTGLLLPPGEVSAWIEGLHALASDRKLRDELGGAARERVSAEFSLDRFLERTGRVYREVAAGHGA
jgi:glycosyltransferase involved in cell wall biosynthesis